MSHIANNIVAQHKALNQVFTGNRYMIDVFQRDYRWKRDQIDALISDLSSSFLNCYKEGDTQADVDKYDCYYMGPIVLCQDDGSLSVFDGQQRLTTMYIFMKIASQEIRSATPPFELEYETRSDSAEFLKSLSDDEDLDKDKNIDFYHIASAYENINIWLDSQPDKSYCSCCP